jgi:RNA polymerase-binding transcription factor DksA
MRPAEEHAALEALIASERNRLAETDAELVAEHEAVVEASADANLDDEHDPEGATVGFERARVASLLDHVRSRMAELDQAAERLRAGTYGECGRCGEPIAFERLEAHPAAVTCVGCELARARSRLGPR